jgi:hypothetical protein
MPRLLTGFIDENDCIGDSLDSSGGINPSFLALDEAVQSLSAVNNSQNTLITNLRTDVNSVSSQVYGSGSVLQTVFRQFTPSPTITLGAAGTVVEITQATPLTITRKRSNSSLLIELFGGRYATLAANQGIHTWLYISLNGGSYNSIFGGATTTQNVNEFLWSSGGGIQGPHSIKYLYQPASNINTVALKIYAASYVGGSQLWAYNNSDGAIPVTYTITEIAT